MIMTTGPGARMVSSFFGGTATMGPLSSTGSGTGSSSSPRQMRFALGKCEAPNSACPNHTTNSPLLEREEGQRISTFSRKRKGKELTKGKDEERLWQRWWPALLKCPDGAMARRAIGGRCAARKACSYLFAQGTCSNEQMMSPHPLLY
jgi:hypothetical protein